MESGSHEQDVTQGLLEDALTVGRTRAMSKHREKWSAASYGLNSPRAYVIVCTCGHWIEAKTRADALLKLHDHAAAEQRQHDKPENR